MTITGIKEKIIKTVNELPEDTSIEEVMERLYLLYKIEKGVEQADKGNVIDHANAKKRFEKWLS